jgi:hypothetical protein
MSEDLSIANESKPTAPAALDGQHEKAISVRKLIANRRNAKKSKCPKTSQGNPTAGEML